MKQREVAEVFIGQQGAQLAKDAPMMRMAKMMRMTFMLSAITPISISVTKCRAVAIPVTPPPTTSEGMMKPAQPRVPTTSPIVINRYYRISFLMFVVFNACSVYPATTMLIIFPGTTMTFFTSLSAIHFCACSSANTAFSTSAGDMSAGSSSLKRILPLKETGY